MQSVSYHRNKQVELFGGRLFLWTRTLHSALCTLRTALRRYQPWELGGGRTVHSLTHAGRNVVQAGLQSAAALLCAVSDVCLQEGNAKLPVVHHADQAAAGLARALPCSSKQTQALTWNSPRDPVCSTQTLHQSAFFFPYYTTSAATSALNTIRFRFK